jgi:predicted small integral membrane protein
MLKYLGIALVLGVAFNEAFHATFDGLQFSANAAIASQVLSMKSTFDPNSWRAINSPIFGYLTYGVFWALHTASGLLGLAGAYAMFRSLKARETRYPQDCSLAMLGVGIGAALYFIGFTTIGGGWFLLYSAPTPPNFSGAATSLFQSYILVILFLHATWR